MRRLPALLLVLAMAVAGCGSSKTAATTAGNAVATATSSSGADMASSTAMSSDMASSDTSGTQCPTSNTRSFAKTRFVSDLGGSAFLIRRYLYQPYTEGKFTKGHSGRTVALVKAAAASATIVKLLKNASLNAKGNPLLCKTVAGPLSSLASTIGGLTGSLGSGSLSPGILGGLGGTVSGLLGKAKSAGVPVTEQPVPVS